MIQRRSNSPFLLLVVSAADLLPGCRQRIDQGTAEVTQGLIHNFGEMSTARRLQQAWTIKNTGEAPLRIWLAKPAPCGCAVASLKLGVREAIPPGGSRDVVLEWGSGQAAKTYAQSVQVATSDPEHPVITFSIQGETFAPVTASPESINLKMFLVECGASGPTEITSRDRPGFKITGIVSSRPALLSARVDDMDGGHRLSVTVKPGMPVGLFHDDIRIKTDHPDNPELNVTVIGRAAGIIHAAPASIVIRGAGRESSISLIIVDGRAARFAVATTPDWIADADVRTDGYRDGTRRYRLVASCRRGTAVGPPGRIVLKTDHPRMPVVSIPAYLAIHR